MFQKNLILYVDTETGGLDPKANEVLDIAAMLIKPEKGFPEMARYHSGVMKVANPHAVEETALAVNKITREQIYNGHDSAVICLNFINWLDAHAGNHIDPVTSAFTLNPVMLAGHNVQFDLRFIESWFARNGYLQCMNRFHYRLIDVQSIAWARLVAAGPLSKSALQACTGYFKVEHAAHTADGDVEAGAEVMRRLIGPMEELTTQK